MLNYLLFLFFSFFMLIVLLIKCNYNHIIDWIGVTGTSDNHFFLTLNFILSFVIYYPNNILVIYNMNLNSTNILYLKVIIFTIKSYLASNRYNGELVYKFFNFSNYPAHFSVANYTWKQLMIYQCLQNYKTMIFWFDGGVEITSKLDYEIDIAKKRGMYIEPSIYPINIFLPNIVAKYFKVNKLELKNYTTINIALIAVAYSKEIIKDVIKPWVDCAYDSSCICPNGVSRINYRYDQTTLFLILYKNKRYKNLVKPVKLNTISHKKECDYRTDCNIFSKISVLLEKNKL